MTHRFSGYAAIALLALASGGAIPSTTFAAEPALLATPPATLDPIQLARATAGPSAAELQRLKNELRFELRGALQSALADSFEHALDDTVVVTD